MEGDVSARLSIAGREMANDARTLRSFAWTTAALTAAVFGLALPWMWNLRWPLWPWVAAAVLAAWALVHPRSLAPVRAAWMRAATAVGHVNNRILLGIVFLAIVTPLGCVRRRFGGDPLARGFDPDATTYRKPASRRPARSLERPF